MKEAEYTATEMKEAEYDATEMKEVGYEAEYLTEFTMEIHNPKKHSVIYDVTTFAA